MKSNSLGFTKLPYGGDWNPEQWDPSVWKEDVALFKQAGIDLLSINIFSWTLNQPDEKSWNFSWLDDVIALLKKNKMRVCLGTSTAAHPAWMASKYPDILRVDFQGRKRKYGDRHNSCPSSPAYRKFAPQMAGKLAERYKNEEAIALWHVSNEFGGECYCENCEKRFREWLKKRYGSIESLNTAWNTRFWSQSYTAWDQIVAPNQLTVHWETTSTSHQSLVLDYTRFNSENLLDCYKLERDAIKTIIPEAIVTTNFMSSYRPLNYRDWATEMDIIAWDNYPFPEHQPSYTAMMHALIRSLKQGEPFMLMEQTPSQTNWQPYNQLKRPGVMRLMSYQAVAQGADAVMFFQMRRSRGACEKFHGAVIEHSGRSDTRVFLEVADLGKELQDLKNSFMGATMPAEIGLWFEWESRWAVENSMGPSCALDYVAETYKYYRPFNEMGYMIDLIGPDTNLSQYKLILAPLLYMIHPGVAEKLSAFVEQGGTLVTGFMSGVADVNDRVFPGGAPGPLKEILGLWSEEIDALAPEHSNSIVFYDEAGPLKGEYQCNLLFDLVRVETAEEVAVYGDDFYLGRAVVTRNSFGKGKAWYVASSPDNTFMKDFACHLAAQSGVKALLKNLPLGIEVSRRTSEKGEEFYFILNHKETQVKLELDDLELQNLLTGQRHSGALKILPKDVVIGRKLTGLGTE
ncbi:MAG: beta-galactosidase [Spirochaetales bacterium]|nr:beta-galactosidase [Spirochaetales bacterium]